MGSGRIDVGTRRSLDMRIFSKIATSCESPLVIISR